MKHFLLHDQLGDGFQTVLDVLDSTEPVTIILACGGGDMAYAEVVLNIINTNPDNFTLISAGSYSAAFYIFMNARCKKKIAKGTLGMFHFPYIKMELMTNGKVYYDQDRAHIKNNKDFMFSYYTSWCNSFMNKEEIEQLHKGDDVFFTHMRMLELFPDAEVI